MDLSKIPADIMLVVNSIVDQFDVKQIYLFSNKRKGVGKSAGFKLCVILNCEDTKEIERKIYRSIDCEVPYDVVLYPIKKWKEHLDKEGSFAQRIVKGGVLVHG